MKKFENIFILKGRIKQEKAKVEFEKIAKDFDKIVKIIDTDYKGKKKLAYSVGNNTTGYYCIMQFETENNAGEIEELETELKNNENVLKFITVRMED